MNNYMDIIKHYENCFDQFGDSHKGVDWPNAEDAMKRHSVMLGVIKEADSLITLLDFGCGLAHLLDFINGRNIKNISYIGLDISGKFINASMQKHPLNKFIVGDILVNSELMPVVDYVVMNGVFTEKRELDYDAMFEYMTKILNIVFSRAQKGIAFNVMTKHVDWERDDLFHVPFDKLAKLFKENFSRNFVFRNDYGLFEYTAYLYH
jgi:SAM-dependent methyltransferase